MKSTSAFYLDHAATTPLDPAVLKAMQPYLADAFANPSSLYKAARQTRGALEAARAGVADTLGAKPTEIIFTSGGTEGNNLAVQGVLRAHPGASWVTTAIEHDSVLGQTQPLKQQGHLATVVPVKPNGIVDVAVIAAAISDDTVLVSVMLANNEIGTIQPVGEVAKLLARVRTDRAKRGIKLPIYLHTDATQAVNYIDLHVQRLGVDLLTLSGSKMYGPKGTGMLYARQSVKLEPLQYGGGQERGRRSGTQNVAGAVGFAKALDMAQAMREAESRRLTVLRNELIHSLITTIAGTQLNGDAKHRLPNNLNLTIDGAEGEGLVLYLDNLGIMASTGSACSSGDLEPSHVLLAIGRTAAQADSSLRLTLGRASDKAAVDTVVKHLPIIVERLRQLSQV